MQEQITIPTWLAVKIETREKLRSIFNVPKSKGTDVVTDHMGNGVIISDGCTHEDLKSITAEKLQDYLGTMATNETIISLFKQAIEKIEMPVVDKPIMSGTPTTSEELRNAQAQAPIMDIKCLNCPYENANPRAMRMHVMKKHPHVS